MRRMPPKMIQAVLVIALGMAGLARRA